MPTYEYRCTDCGHRWEEYQLITAKPIRKCPACRKLKAQREISAGGAVLFKGSGFYQTDYRSESYKKGAEASKKASDAATSSGSGGGAVSSGSGNSGNSKAGGSSTGTA